MRIAVLLFVVGIVSVQQLSALPSIEWWVLLSCLTLALGLLRHWRLMFFVMGVSWALGFAMLRISDRLPETQQGQMIKIEGTIVGLPQRDERRVRFDFKVSKPEESVPSKLRLSWFFPKQAIKSGQKWQFTVKLKKPHGRFNPNGFDYERWLYSQNIGATGYVRSKPPPILLQNHDGYFNIDVLRQNISETLTNILAQSNAIGLIKALTIGDRHEVNNKQWDVFRKTGTVHLLAISGLHIGLIAGIAYFIVHQFSARLAVSSPQLIAAICCMVVAVFYAALAGFSLPTQRALIMLAIAMLANCWQRNIKPSNTIALTMFAVLVFDPLAVLSAGFWLSFLAVTVIIYSVGGRLGKPAYWLSTLKIHWVTAIGLSPLLIFYFNQVSVIAPLANLVTVPFISLLIVPLCLIAVSLMFIVPVFSKQLFQVADSLLELLWSFLSVLANLPFADLSSVSVPFYTVAMAMCGIAVLLLPKGIPCRHLGVIMFLPMVFVDLGKLNKGEATLTLLDVGQGLSAVIETSEHVLVFDTGAKYSNQYNMGNAVVIPFLQSNGIDSIDMLLISHGDNDHIGGADAILSEMTVEKVLTSVPEKLPDHQAISCYAGQSWYWDDVGFEILSPKKAKQASENNLSCVLKVSSKYGSILLTGDIEADAENWLINNAAQKLSSDVLVAPHHGSKTSSNLSFLEQVKPAIILIPAGYKNRFSFPHSKVIKRYNDLKLQWINSAYEGAINVKLKSNAILVSSLRKQQGKYWNKVE